ncbi:MAG: Txe/YoeB family addiction module toxin [Aphanizomenon gracile PMC649.10]|nr:Txe/YoeB family addiction module toxin [Aphanizomenon gracile PMC638.10]MDM3849038.1 Txe/YoeB family addiction module toxin [Aphanizomenon gracile PMC627.10]MDM3856496.1 Txe/YoeB family addiction module toxin [Aphanizomenon gracile PMC649.10]MDM3862224.1 Txe/YoeB family addiction module toxin [Aphanizomenon gracile PMC644.10]
MQVNPFQNPPPYEKLVGDLEGAYSRRINIQHRLVYEVIEDENILGNILKMIVNGNLVIDGKIQKTQPLQS